MLSLVRNGRYPHERFQTRELVISNQQSANKKKMIFFCLFICSNMVFRAERLIYLFFEIVEINRKIHPHIDVVGRFFFSLANRFVSFIDAQNLIDSFHSNRAVVVSFV